MTIHLDAPPTPQDGPFDEPAPESTGVIGDRHLIAVQTIDIARLTTHPVPLMTGCFVVVTGQGPKGDSNGSGKTSFESAVSLLLGDAQWRLEGNGAAAAAGLLFRPESAGLDPTHRYPPADRGYVIGVFADPRDAVQSALTVWLRIAVTSPYLRVRWVPGLHTPTGDSDAERYGQADRLWDTLPRASEIGPTRLARELYGPTPRCMAYLDTTLRKTGPSLLSQQMTELSTERIGEALIELTGRSRLLETEERQRGVLAEQQQKLTSREADDARARVDEQSDLDAVRHRNEARVCLDRGEGQWRLHFARGLLDLNTRDATLAEAITEQSVVVNETTRARDTATAAVEGLRAVLDPGKQADEARQRWEDAEALYKEIAAQSRDANYHLGGVIDRRDHLLPIADGWTGLSVSDAQAADDAAWAARDDRRADRQLATRTHDAAAAALEQVSAGRGGQVGTAIAVLHEVGIEAVALLDAVSLHPTARTVWEPRLWPYRDAVCIAAGDEQPAAASLAAAGLSGTILVQADADLDATAGELGGGVSSTIPVAGFVAALAATHEVWTDPDRARNVTVGHVVLGGFDTEIAGRAARIAAAQTEVERAAVVLTATRHAEHLADLAVQATTAALAAAQAVADLAELNAQEQHYQTILAAVAPELARRDADQAQAREDYITAHAAALNHQQKITLADAHLQTCDEAQRQAHGVLQTLRNERAAVDLDYWAEGWGADAASARDYLDTLEESARRLTAATWRNRASDALNDALRAYVGGGAEVPPELHEAQRRREQLRDDSGRIGRDSVSFSSVAQPLRDLLDARLDMDKVMEDRIVRGQAERASQIQAIRADTTQRATELRDMQDAISNRVEAALRAISAALDGLNRGRGGFGAELKITETRPVSPTAPWKWAVTPRWRRSPAGNLVSYKEVANGAQVKQIAIQLVLAALLAQDGAQGRVLILDELGNSLGDVNRKQVLADLHQVAVQQNITILGTCQDSVLHDAASACGQILWFAHQSPSDAYNLPTRMWAFDSNGERVEMLADWLTAGRGLV